MEGWESTPWTPLALMGVGMGALEMQILAALATSGGPLLGQTGAAWTVEKTQPHDAPRDLKDVPQIPHGTFHATS